jgi:nicotinamidase-related amidase
VVLLGRPVLLTIDVQRDVVCPGGSLPVPGAAACVPVIGRVVEAFRAQRLPIVHVVRLYLADGSNAEPVRRSLVTSQSVLRPGTPGSELAEELQPPGAPGLDPSVLLSGDLQQLGANEWAMYKPRWGAFYGTRLEAHLRELEVDTVVFAGCNFPNCPRASLYEASERDFQPVLIRDAVSGVYERGLEEVAGIGADVLLADELVAQLAGDTAGAGR